MNNPKHLLVIGKTSSLFAAIQSAFARAGWKITATTRQNASLTDIELDLNSVESINKLAASAPKFSNVDCLLILSGSLPGLQLREYSAEQIALTINANLSGPLAAIRALHPALKPGSQIIWLSSISGQRGSHDPVYAAAKAGILGAVKSLSKEFAPQIRVNAIAPGLILNSKMYNDMVPEARERHLQTTPTGKLMDMDDLAKILLDLTAPHWAHLNGACVDLNGGQFTR